MRSLLKKEQMNKYALTALYILILLPFMGFTGLRTWINGTIYQGWQSASLVMLLLLVVLHARSLRIDLFCGMFMLYNLVIQVSTVRHHGFSIGIAVVSLVAILLVLLMQVNLRVIVRALTIIGMLSLIINLAYMLVLRKDPNITYFIGGKNAFSIFLIPIIYVVLINAQIMRGTVRRSEMLFAVLALFTILWGNSATGVVAAIATAALLLLFRKHKPNTKVFVLGILAINILLVFFSRFLFESKAWLIFTQWLGKEATLTSRTEVWESAKGLIRENWLLGTGRGTQIFYQSRYGSMEMMEEAHNFILEILLEGGVVALAAYALLFWDAIRNLNMENRAHKLAFLAITVLLINGLVEATNNNILVIIIMAIARYLPQQNDSSGEQIAQETQPRPLTDAVEQPPADCVCNNDRMD